MVGCLEAAAAAAAAADVGGQLLEHVEERGRGAHAPAHGEAQPVRLARPVVRVLAQHDDLRGGCRAFPLLTGKGGTEPQHLDWRTGTKLQVRYKLRNPEKYLYSHPKSGAQFNWGKNPGENPGENPDENPGENPVKKLQ